MRKITKSEKILTLSILLLAGMVAGYVFLYKHITKLHTDLGTVSSELNSVIRVVENKQSTISLLEKTKHGREEMKGYFVSANDPTQFLNLIDTIGTETDVDVESVGVEMVSFETLNKKFPEELQKKATVVLSVKGGWDEIYHFISLLELFPYVATIDRTAITYKEANENGPWEGLIHIHTNAI